MNIKQYTQSLNTFSLPKAITIIVLALVVVSVFIRAQDVGYSNLQGDEIQTVDFMYTMDNGVVDYLLAQKRGPTQYVLNLLNVGMFGYHNEFQIRLPYLVFAILAFASFYLCAKILMQSRAVGFIAVLFLAVNGLYIAFARITQYQSIMYFLIPLIVFLFVTAIDSQNKKLLYLTSLLTSLAILTHYDTLSVLAFIGTTFFIVVMRKNGKENVSIVNAKSITVFVALLFLLPLLFYIPLYLNREFDAKTSGYLEGRLFGGALMPRTGIIIRLLSMYIPTPALYAFYFLSIGALYFFTHDIDLSSSLPKLKRKIPSKWYHYLYIFFVSLHIFATTFSLYPIKPRTSTVLVFISTIVLMLLLMFSRKIDYKKAALSVWFLFAYAFYFFLMKDARTHVYIVMIPAFILSAFTIFEIYRRIRSKYLQYAYLTVFVAATILLTWWNWLVFVDKTPEYPWFPKYIFGREMYDLPRFRPKKIDGVFGFNNWRGWELVAQDFENGCLRGTYDSNEKNSITYFYTRQNQLRGEKGTFYGSIADTIIIVEGPHSWEYLQEGEQNFPGYTLVRVIETHGTLVTYIYSKNFNRNCYDTQ